MGRNDDGFNLDDMLEIFGDAMPAVSTPVATVAPAAPAPPAPPSQAAPAARSDAGGADEGLTEDEQALLLAYEAQKQERRKRDEEARRKKDEDAKRILEEYERTQREHQQREAREREEREAKQRSELEALKKKEEFKVDAQRLADEERRIIEEFERDAAAQKIRQEEERKAKEAAAQAELQHLAEQQQREESKRDAEAAAQEAEMQAKAQAVSKKDSRLLELLAKAQMDLKGAGPIMHGPEHEGAAPAPAAAPAFEDALLDIELPETEAFCAMVDESRKIMFTFLAPLIGIKAATNMLNKTVEKARSKAPVVLKDANWRMDGSLREDGSVDSERLFKNVSGLPAATRVQDFLAGLRELVSLRFKAVEVGLGASTAGDMKAKVMEARGPLVRKPLNEKWVDIFYRRVVG
jgi:hypothetical protein